MTVSELASGKMSAVVDRYSRAVLWLKVLLPLTALAILSVLFSIAESIDPDRAIPISDQTLAEYMATKGLHAPRYSGVAEGGHQIDAQAKSFTPKADGAGFDAKDISAVIVVNGDNRISIDAPIGEIDRNASLVRLGGGAALVTTDGYEVRTDDLFATLDMSRIFTNSSVSARAGALGGFVAGSMELINRETADGETTLMLIFKDGVRLVYKPQPNEGD